MNPVLRLILSFPLLFVFVASIQAQAQGGSLLITEVMFNPAGADENEEWIEIAYFGNTSLDISDYKIGDEETAGDNEGIYRFPAETTIEPDQLIIIAQTATAFHNRYGFSPNFEIKDSDPSIPDMRPFPALANGDLALANSGDEIILYDEQDRLVDGLNYGKSTFFFQPAVSIDLLETGESIGRVSANCDTDSHIDWQINPIETPGEIAIDDNSESCQLIAQSTPTPPPPIGSIQGEEAQSAADQSKVTVQGVVTALHQDNNASGETFYTLYIQDDGDGNAQTSDAIPLFFGRQLPDAQVGDLLLVTGTVTEYYDLTEFESQGLEITVISQNESLPAPIPLPTAGCSQIDCETVESMRVTIDTAVVVGPTFETASGCGFAVAPQAAQLTRLIRHSAVDDTDQIIPVLAPNDNACDQLPQLKVGDVVHNLTGPLTYNFEQYKIIPENLSALTIEAASMPLLPPPPNLDEGEISIASFNVENLFDTIDDTGDEAEPKPTAVQIALKQEKLAQTISQVTACPTLLAIQEVEKASLLDQLADQLEPLCGFRYQVNHLESYDGRGIDNALLNNPEITEVTGFALEQSCTPIKTDIAGGDCPNGTNPLFSRPPFRVELTAYGRDLTVYVNHFKSKRGGEQETAPRRLAQADHLTTLVQAQLQTDPHALIVVLGDLNDYADSAPLSRLTASGQLANVLRQLPPEQQYSFNFGGAAQLIDALLLSPAAQNLMVTTEIYHVNADFPEGWGEDRGRYAIYRSSDHDIPLVVLQLDDPDLATAEPTPISSSESSSTPPAPSFNNPTPPERTSNIWFLIAGMLGVLLGGAGLRLWQKYKA